MINLKQEEIRPHVFDRGGKTYRGYTLLASLGGTELHLIDMTGRSVHRWRMPQPLGTHGVLLPNGNLLCAAWVPQGPLADFDGAAGRIYELDWNGHIVWQYEDLYMHHDLCRMPNGNTLLLRWVPTPKDIAMRVRGGLPGTEREGIMWSDAIREINPVGEVIWEWEAYEHLDPDIDIICPLCFRNEWTHANSFSVNDNGEILVSFMKMNSIGIIGKETGDIDWRWGGFLKLAHPHDVSWIDNENVMVLGCGGHIAGTEVGDSEILRIDTRTNNIEWEFKEVNSTDFYAPCKGSFQPLPNGNILICEGDKGRIFEVRSETKEIVWEFTNSSYHLSSVYGNNNMLFRAYRYGPDYEGLKGSAFRVDKSREGINPRRTKEDASKEEKAIQDRLGNLGY